MKIKISFLTFFLAMALTFPAFAQDTPAPDSVRKPEMKQHDMMNMMEKPTFEATSGDLHFSIWITTQEDHKKMMAEMSGKGMDKDMGSMKDKDKVMDKDMGSMKDEDKGMDKDMGSMKDKDKGMDKDMAMKEKGMKKDTCSKKDKAMVMDNATKEAMMSGTHHIMVGVKNTASGKETNAVSAKVEIVSPTNKISSVDLLTPMMNHFGNGLTLDEKGEYQFTVSVLTGNVSETIKMKYTVL